MQTGKMSLYFPGIINFPLEKYIFLLLSKQITAKNKYSENQRCESRKLFSLASKNSPSFTQD